MEPLKLFRMRSRHLFLVFLMIALTGLYYSRAFVLGRLAEPFLSYKLTQLFGMRVEIRGLSADPLSGQVHASRVQFMNQPQFSHKPHLDVWGVDFHINFPALRRRHVEIDTIELNTPFYYIERIRKDGDTISNVKMWVHHIEGEDDGKPEAPSDPAKKWRVQIGRIAVHGGTFLYRLKEKGKTVRKLEFRSLYGYLDGFDWPTPDPKLLPQTVHMLGVIGEKKPAPISIQGRSNFATSRISFDAFGEIRDGLIEDHKALFKGLPIEVTGGTFNLRTQLVCETKQLKTRSDLELLGLRVELRRSATGLIWALPALASIQFLQAQKSIKLDIPVEGYISDPQFRFLEAFRNAFQQSLYSYTKAGLHMISLPIRKAGETGEAIIEMLEKAPIPVAKSLPAALSGSRSKKEGTDEDSSAPQIDLN